MISEYMCWLCVCYLPASDPMRTLQVRPFRLILLFGATNVLGSSPALDANV
jgi:hypothetical protein